MPLFGKKPEPMPIVPPKACPNCGGYDFAILTQLYNIRHDNAAEVCGYRVSCQRCGDIFNATTTGMYRADEDALPPTMKPGEAERRIVAQLQRRPEEPKKDDDRKPRPPDILPPMKRKEWNP